MNPKIEKVMKKFDKVRNELIDFGACDTGPDGCFHLVVKAAIAREDYPIIYLEQWELFFIPGWKKAASKLNTAAKGVYRIVMKEARSEDVKELQRICWRVNF